ncbi:hypothetical protein ACL2XQ_05715 [Sodalis sp. RH14]|uniref:hypothetical protein n=1 Tax=Sodalis sp. RH14 TaxID=3394329 RepID=UPI0039B6904E
MKLTIEIFVEGRWQDAASITFSEPDQGRASLTLLGYAFDYALEFMERDDEHACSSNLPAVLMENYRSRPAVNLTR